jgi:hypothetical protein
MHRADEVDVLGISVRRRRLPLLAGSAFVGVAMTAAVAVALWSASGFGEGAAATLADATITVTASTGTADLYPGFTQGDVHFTSANDNPYDVTLTAMTPGTVTSSDEDDCPADNVSVASASGLTLDVPAGASAQAGTIPDVVSMAAGAPNGCQGVSFSVALTLTGTQS